nr:uncharacterized protein LOC108132302 [Drosophila bipectinata]
MVFCVKMFLLGICLIGSLYPALIGAYPLDSLSSLKDSLRHANAPAAPLTELSEYPDLTNGLTDAEVQATLQDLSLEDLNSLEKLLDEHCSRDEDADREASLTDQGRKPKLKFDSFKDLDLALDDSCLEDDDCEPSSTKRTTTTTVCTTTACTTRRCTKKPTCKPHPKTTRVCKTTTAKPKDPSCDDTDLPKPARPKIHKTPRDEECEADDFMCLARKKERLKKLRSKSEAAEEAVAPVEAPAEYKPSRELAGIEQLDEEYIPSLNEPDELLDEPFEFLQEPKLQGEPQSNLELGNPVQLEEKSQPTRGRREPDNEASLRMDQQANLDNFKMGNQANLEPELSNASLDQQVQPMGGSESDGQSLLESLDSPSDSQRKKKAAESEKPVEEQLPRVEEQLPRLEEKKPLVAKEPLPLQADLGKQAPAFDAESFIANNARDPPRYLIQMQDGFIQSDNDPGERRLQADRSQSEALDLDKLAVKEPSPFHEDESNFEAEYKRNKRENKEADDAPETNKETYLKDLMDSFPRDQGGHINANVALRASNLAHLRTKRS